MSDSVSSFLDSLLLMCNIFVVGVGVGAFLCYNYVIKSDGPKVMITSSDDSGSSNGWRASNPDELAVERPSDQNNRRRRSSLYH